ncbi:V-set domain-containing T-cell activation inhibitor 1-like isoform X2 [Cheilinus undulatus]|nr:V-set domain-containing T-cell activation inhibitor 1-like isoform X2 [Cheilinus undulatus]
MDVQRVEVKEGDDAVLLCSTNPKMNLEPTVFHWKTPDENGLEVYFYDNGVYSGKGSTGQDRRFVNRVSHFQDELKNGNASIKITKTEVDDSGNYTCIFPFPQPSQMYYIQLVVRASPKPRIKVVNQTEDWALLQCEIKRASPKPFLELQDSFGNILHAHEISTGETHDITVQATVNKTDLYRCVLRQEELYHEISDDAFVFMPKKVSRTEAIIGGVFGGWFLGAGTVIVSLLLALRFSPRLRNRVISFLLKLQPKDKRAQENGDLNNSMMAHRSPEPDFC